MMMEPEYPQTERQAQAPQRPVFLTILCILTFLGSGIMAVSFFFVGVFHDMIIRISTLPELQMPGIETFQNTERWVFMVGSFFYLLSFVGGLLIWNLIKKGFHLYASSQIALLFLTAFFVYPGGVPSGDLLFTSSFVLLYAFHLKIMK